MDHDGYACAALPLSGLYMAVTACHAHQAVTIRVHGLTQADDDLVVWWEPAPVEFGPFDGASDIEADLTAAAGRLGARLPDLLRRVRS